MNDFYKQNNVDMNRLSRDYIENPLKPIIKPMGGYKIENPNKKDVEYLYIELNIEREILARYFNISASKLKKILVEYNIHKSENQISNNRIKNNLRKYGCSSTLQEKETKRKTIKTNIQRYNYDNPMKNKDIQNKVKKTNNERYGVEYPFQSDEIKDKIYQTSRIKYGVDRPSKCCEIKNKIYQTKCRNHSHNISKPEKEIERLLKEKYPNTKTQYKSKEYPFNCDFYIPEIDTYIEYQGNWTHGREPYIGTQDQKDKVEFYKEKNSKYYDKVIYDWIVRDPYKREMARINGLNYLEFFNMKQFMVWFNEQ